jgi:hypothetical protein
MFLPPIEAERLRRNTVRAQLFKVIQKKMPESFEAGYGD